MGAKENLEIGKNVVARYENIKSIADSAMSLLMNKTGKYVEDDFSKSFELTEQLQIELEEIRELLIELEQS
jgi:hypothetical protein